MVELVQETEMDPIEASIMELVAKGKKQGFLSWEELNQRLPDEAITPDKLEVIMLRLDEAGIEMMDEAEASRMLENRQTKSQKDADAKDGPDEVSPEVMADDAVARRIVKQHEEEERRTTRVHTDRYEFRFKEVSVNDAGRDGRSRKGTGWRYGAPFDDRKRGVVKIPTSVP